MKNEDAAHRDTPREVRFTRAAVDNVKALQLSPVSMAILKRRLKDVAALEDVTDDPYVCKIAQTGGRWYRLKLANLRPSTRIAFSLEERGDVLLVRFIGARCDETYDVIAQIYRLVRAA